MLKLIILFIQYYPNSLLTYFKSNGIFRKTKLIVIQEYGFEDEVNCQEGKY